MKSTEKRSRRCRRESRMWTKKKRRRRMRCRKKRR